MLRILGKYNRNRSKHSEGVKRTMKRATVTIAVAVVAILVIGGNAQAVQIPSGQGVEFEQVDFLFTAATIYDSDWGQITANPVDLHSYSDIYSGYINIYTDVGWIVQNMPVDLSDGSDPIITYFSLGLSAPQNVNTLSAYVDFTQYPQLTFADGARGSFSVGVACWNAEGAGDSQVTDIGAAPPGNITYTGGETTKHTIPDAMNVNKQTAKNQCFPMAVANSLQYLENRYVGICVIHDHKMGLKGDNTLVGKLDEYAKRRAPARKNGDPVTVPSMLRGKFEYLEKHGLKDKLIHKHQGGDIGDFTSNGTTSTNEGPKVTAKWICDEIKNKEDVELFYLHHGGGGHVVRVVGCGKTGGKYWIEFLHDAIQSDGHGPKGEEGDKVGLQNRVYMQLNTTKDGTLTMGSKNWTVYFAMSESPPPGTPEIPEFTTIAIPVAAVMGLLFLFSRRKRKV